MQISPEIAVTLSDELLDVLQAQARVLRVPLRWVIASLVCDTIETDAVPQLIPIHSSAQLAPEDAATFRGRGVLRVCAHVRTIHS